MKCPMFPGFGSVQSCTCKRLLLEVMRLGLAVVNTAAAGLSLLCAMLSFNGSFELGSSLDLAYGFSFLFVTVVSLANLVAVLANARNRRRFQWGVYGGDTALFMVSMWVVSGKLEATAMLGFGAANVIGVILIVVLERR
jgi:hypothetical protein